MDTNDKELEHELDDASKLWTEELEALKAEAHELPSDPQK